LPGDQRLKLEIIRSLREPCDHSTYGQGLKEAAKKLGKVRCKLRSICSCEVRKLVWCIRWSCWIIRFEGWSSNFKLLAPQTSMPTYVAYNPARRLRCETHTAIAPLESNTASRYQCVTLSLTHTYLRRCDRSVSTSSIIPECHRRYHLFLSYSSADSR